MSDDAIAYCKIFPSIGLARFGNSPDELYLGPQAPGRPLQPAGGFKDELGRVKRQVAQFRVYAFSADHKALREITADEAEITWTVHLANKKASFYEFQSRYVEQPPLRNRHVQADLPPDQRSLLIIDPGPRSIRGRSQSGAPEYRFDTGSIGPLPIDESRTDAPQVRETARVFVPLGEIRTDDAGRLLVLSASGSAGALLDAHPITDYANNDYWYDEAADGPVMAQVTLHDGQQLRVEGRSWVMCVPPHFATETTCITTLYDQMEEVAGLSHRDPLSFTRDLWPIFSRVASYRWVNRMALIGHGPGRWADFLKPSVAARLADNSQDNRGFREQIFMRIRDPGLIPEQRIWNVNSGEQYPPAAAEQADGFNMPPMAGDYAIDGPVNRDATTWLAVSPAQYEWLRRWRDGDFENDWPALGVLGLPTPPPFDELPVSEQPMALTRAMLERTIGAPFYPGIEMSYNVRDKSLYAEPFRFADDLTAGDITRWMALPWHADFFECNTYWWPAARPDDVVPAEIYLAVAKEAQRKTAFLLTAEKLEQLRETVPPEVVDRLLPMLDRPFTTLQDVQWILEQLMGAETYARWGLVVLELVREYDFISELGSLEQRRQWARGLGGPDDIPHGDNEMVRHWHELGFVVPVAGPNGQVAHIELERAIDLPQSPPKAGTP